MTKDTWTALLLILKSPTFLLLPTHSIHNGSSLINLFCLTSISPLTLSPLSNAQPVSTANQLITH